MAGNQSRNSMPMTDEQIGLGQALSDADIGLGTEPSLAQQALGGLKRGYQLGQQMVQPIKNLGQQLNEAVSPITRPIGRVFEPVINEAQRFLAPEAFRDDPGENVQLAPRYPGLDPTDAMFAMNRPILSPQVPLTSILSGLPPFMSGGGTLPDTSPVRTAALKAPIPDLPVGLQYAGVPLAILHELLPFAATGEPIADVIKAEPAIAQVAAAYFAKQAQESVPQRFAQARQEGGTGPAYAKAGLGSIVDIAAPLGLVSLRAPDMRSGIRYEDIPGRRSADVPIDDDMIMKEQIGPERQLGPGEPLGPPKPPRFQAGPPPAEAVREMSGSEWQRASATTQMYSGLPTDFEDYKRLVGEMRTALAAKDFDKVYDLQGKVEEIKGRNKGLPPTEQAKADDLRPAVKVGERTLIGEPGDTHAMVLERNGMDPESIPHADPRRGFVNVNKPDEFLDRTTAAKAIGVQGTAEAVPGGLDSMDLPGAKKGTDPNAIRELHPDSLSKAQPSGDIQTLGQEVREGADAPRETQEGQGEETQLSSGLSYQQWTDLHEELMDKLVAIRMKQYQQTEFDPKLEREAEAAREALSALNHKYTYYAEVRDQPGVGGPPFNVGPDMGLNSGLPMPSKALVDKIKDRARLAGGAGREFWMQTTGHLIEADKGHYAKAKEILGETGAGEARDVDADVKHVYNAMEQRGFTRFTEQGDKYVVDNAIGPRQLDAVNRLAAEKGKQVFDESGKLIRDFRYDIPGEVRLGSGIPLFQKETWEDSWDKSKFTTAPLHVRADEHVANRMAEYVAADVTTAVGGFSPNYKENVRKSWVQAGINAGLYEKAKTQPMIGGEPAVLVKDLGVWVRKDLAPEVEQAVKNRGPVQQGVYRGIIDLVTKIQVLLGVDLGYHSANLFSTVAGSAGKSSNYLVDQVLRQWGVKHADAVVRIGLDFAKVVAKDPSINAELTRISALGALRPIHESQAAFHRITGHVLDTNKWLGLIDRAARLSLNGMYDNLLKQYPKLKDNAVDRREFINAGGQYLDGLMSQGQEWMRDHFSQFVVAGRTMNRNAVRRWGLVNQVRTTDPATYTKMKVSNLIAAVSTWITIPVLINMATTGRPFGRRGTPIGKVDTGKDGEDGRHIVVDMAKMDLSRRGARITGSEALIEGVRQGKSAKDISASMVSDVVRGVMHPWEGPPTRVYEAFVEEMAKTHKPDEAIMKAALAVNPLAPNVSEKLGLEMTGEPIKTISEKAGDIIGVGKGRRLRHTETVEEAAGKSVEDMSLDERTDAERQYKLHAEKLPPMQRAEAAGRAVENNARRGQEVMRSMSKADQGWLQSRGLSTPGFDNKLKLGGTEVYLNDKETKRLSDLVKDEYASALTDLRESYDEAESDEAKAHIFSTQMGAARSRARAAMLDSLSESDTKRKGPPGLSMPTR